MSASGDSYNELTTIDFLRVYGYSIQGSGLPLVNGELPRVIVENCHVEISISAIVNKLLNRSAFWRNSSGEFVRPKMHREQTNLQMVPQLIGPSSVSRLSWALSRRSSRASKPWLGAAAGTVKLPLVECAHAGFEKKTPDWLMKSAKTATEPTERAHYMRRACPVSLAAAPYRLVGPACVRTGLCCNHSSAVRASRLSRWTLTPLGCRLSNRSEMLCRGTSRRRRRPSF